MRHAIVVGTCLDLEHLRAKQYGLTILSSTNELIREIRRLLSRVRSNSSLNLSKREDEGRFEDGPRTLGVGNGGMDVDPDDDLLFAVMHLAKVTEVRNSSTLSDPLKPHSERRTDLFKPPVFLRRLQYLHVWGRSHASSPASEASLHLSKLETLVVIKGGLQRVKTPGYAEALHLFDIIGSAKRLERPRFEMPRSSIDFLQEKMPTLRKAAALRMQTTRIRGEIYQHLPLNSPLGEIFQDIQIFCSCISSLVRLGPGEPGQNGNRDSYSSSAHTLSCEDIIVLRNLIEYRLLAHCPDPNNVVESVMWTSAMIFTHAVVFPLPHPASLQILARRLRETLRAGRAHDHLASRCEPLRGAFETSPPLDPGKTLLVWAAMMGVMATSDSDSDSQSQPQCQERVFFLNCLGRCLSESDVSSWTQLKSILGAYLWLDWACDAGGLAVWEMLALHHARHMGVARNSERRTEDIQYIDSMIDDRAGR